MDGTEKELVTNTDMDVKEWNTDMETEHNVMKEAINPPIAKKNIDTVKKREKSQAYNIKVDTSRINKSEKIK